MDTWHTIRDIVADEDGNLSPDTLGRQIADALEPLGIDVADSQVADYIRELGDRAELTVDQIADRLTEVIEEDLEDDEADA